MPQGRFFPATCLRLQALSPRPCELAVGPGWDLDLLAQASQRQASMWCLPAHSPSPQASDSAGPALDARSWPGFLRSERSCQGGRERSQSHVATGFSTSRESMGLLESDTTERLHFHFSLSCIGEGNGNPLQCSCLENPRDGEAWWAAVYGVTQSWTRLK